MNTYNNKQIAENFGTKEEYTGSVKLRNRLRKTVGKMLNGRIIDAGCGNGLLLKEIDDFDLYVGVDSSIQMLEVAKQMAKGKNNAFFIHADINMLPFKDKVVDKIVCIDALHHLENDEKELNAIKELNRVGKELLFEFKSFDSLSSLRSLFYRLSNKKEKNTEIDKISYHAIKLDKVISLLKELNKREIKVKRISWLVDWRLIIC